VQAACAASHFGRAASSAIIKLGLQFFILALTLVCTGAGQGAYASTLDPDAQAQEALAQAREALNDKAWGRAELFLERVLMLAPEQAEARVMLASLMAQVGRVETALLLLQSLIDDPRTPSEYRVRLRSVYALLAQAPRLASLSRASTQLDAQARPSPYWRSELGLGYSTNPLARTSASELPLTIADSLVSLPLTDRPQAAGQLHASLTRLGGAYGMDMALQRLMGQAQAPAAARLALWGPINDFSGGALLWQGFAQQSLDDQRRYSLGLTWLDARQRVSLATVAEPTRQDQNHWLRYEQRALPLLGGVWGAQLERGFGAEKSPNYVRLGATGDYSLGAQRYLVLQWQAQADLTGYSPLLANGARRWLDTRSVAVEQHLALNPQNILVFRVLASERRSNLTIFSFRELGFQVSLVTSWL
jgi:hypothetical protein